MISNPMASCHSTPVRSHIVRLAIIRDTKNFKDPQEMSVLHFKGVAFPTFCGASAKAQASFHYYDLLAAHIPRPKL
jgi:hypothetical protein